MNEFRGITNFAIARVGLSVAAFRVREAVD